MAENTQTPEHLDSDQTEPKVPFTTKLALKYPRTTKVAAIIVSTVAVAGVAVTANTVVKNRTHVKAAADHAQEALHELSTSVSPTDAEA